MKTKCRYTDNDFEQFVRACRKYVRMFGLTEYDIHYGRAKLKGAFAETQTLQNRLVANILLDSQDSVSLENVETLALHEVLELLLSEYVDRNSKVGSLEEDRLRHKIIYRLMKVLLPDGGACTCPSAPQVRSLTT